MVHVQYSPVHLAVLKQRLTNECNNDSTIDKRVKNVNVSTAEPCSGRHRNKPTNGLQMAATFSHSCLVVTLGLGYNKKKIMRCGLNISEKKEWVDACAFANLNCGQTVLAEFVTSRAIKLVTEHHLHRYMCLQQLWMMAPRENIQP